MEKRIQKKTNNYFKQLKQDIIKQLGTKNEILSFLENYPNLLFEKDDFQKRKRNKSIIPPELRCIAKKASGNQCTRRRKDNNQLCGTHSKGTPHGIIKEIKEKTSYQKVCVQAKLVNGIIYFIDNDNNVYNPTDIYNEEPKISIIGKLIKKSEDDYIIEECLT
ncbi:hypothetical protein OAI84_00110 [bacterium]|nr:hypothetical protein [bacterium]